MHCVFCLIFRMFKLSLFHDPPKKKEPKPIKRVEPHCDRNGSPRGGPFWFVDETDSSRPASQPPFMFPRSLHGFTVSAPHGTRVMSHLSALFVWMSRPALPTSLRAGVSHLERKVLRSWFPVSRAVGLSTRGAEGRP